MPPKSNENIAEIPVENEVTRERSTIAFPYLDLDDAVEVAKGVHAAGGQSCQWEQLAAELGQAANGGGFRLRVLTAKLFGLLTYDRGMVTLTSLGSRVCDPEQEKAALAESFLNVPLYRSLYDQYKSTTLPQTSGLETAIRNLGVARKQISKARQIFQRSANEAGFFAYGSTRLVMPSIKTGSKSETEESDFTEEKNERDKPEKPAKQHHPLIDGLIRTLPDANTQWALQDRKKWLLAASNIFDLIYTDSDEGRDSLKIEIEKGSAK